MTTPTSRTSPKSHPDASVFASIINSYCFKFLFESGSPTSDAQNVLYIAMAGIHQIWCLFLEDGIWLRKRYLSHHNVKIKWDLGRWVLIPNTVNRSRAVPARDGAREEMLGDKNCQSANGERSEQNFYGPHLSDWLKMRLHSLKA